jgi:predicted transcriptional regulator
VDPTESQKLTPLELQVLEALWNKGRLSVREIQESFPADGRPAYSTVQTTVVRLEEQGVVKRIRKIGNAQIYSAAITRQAAGGRLLQDLVSLFGGQPKFLMAHMVETGELTLDDIKEAERLLRELEGRDHE